MRFPVRIQQGLARDYRSATGLTYRLGTVPKPNRLQSRKLPAWRPWKPTLGGQRCNIEHALTTRPPNVAQSETAPSRETFECLADEWLRERPRGVDIAQMTRHPAYQDIIDLGDPAVPWILQRLAHKPDHWFVALSSITDASPVPPASRGRLDEMTAAWLDWGRQQGYGTLVDVD